MNALDVLCAQLRRDLFAIAKFLLYRALVLVNEFAEFSLPNSITFGDTEGCHNKKWGLLLISPDAA